jgi:hypothetical protein
MLPSPDALPPRPELIEQPNIITPEWIDDATYVEHLNLQAQRQRHDHEARERARKLLHRYGEGFTPNLLGKTPQMAYDGIVASRTILQLLHLSLAEDERCSLGDSQRSAYTRPEQLRTARACGFRLYGIGGASLMAEVLQRWVPAFDQPDLDRAWDGIGDWTTNQ